VDSRTTTDAIRRRRACSTCGHRFTTFERVERRVIWVQKKDGRKELFSREKILGGIALACRKRPVTATQMDQVVNEVEAHLQAASEPTSDLVGEAVMGALRSVDEVAYLRFASVYREFESVEQFLDTIRPLREPN
jgi:transcriptional repressor NrdR